MNDECRVIVLRLVSSYLTFNDALKLLCLNKYFRDHLPNSLFKEYIVHHALAIIFSDEQEPKTIDQMLEIIGFSTKSYDILYNSIKYSKNLVRNPYGVKTLACSSHQDNLDNWALRGWRSIKAGKRIPGPFNVPRYLVQDITLPETSNRFLWAKAITSTESLSGRAYIEVEFDNNEIFIGNIEQLPNYTYRKDAIDQNWLALRLKCRVPDEVRSVKLKLRAGHTYCSAIGCGMQFRKPSLRIITTSNEPNSEQEFERKVGNINKKRCIVQ